jgi:phosphoribosylformylglycinamidine cyclo-ligase
MESTTKNEQRGVSMSKNDVRNAIQDKGLFPKSFCKIVPDVFGDFARPLFSKPTVNVMHTDGAGTKAILAYLYWKETGDLNVWKGIAQDAVVMNLDDLLCSGITNNILLSLTINRNRFRIPDEVMNTIILGVEECLEELRSLNISIHFGGGQTADVGDLVQTIAVDCTSAARIRQNEIIANDRIQDGDVIIGLASYGQATYENAYKSGIGSTGFTAAQHDVLSKYYAEKYPESFDGQITPDLAYTGSKKLPDPSPVADFNVGQLLLSPSRTYVPVMKAILENFRPSIHGLVHCTNNGQAKCLNFVNDMHIVKDRLFAVAPVFSMIQSESNTSWEEMYKVFNMGHRFEIFTKEKIAADVLKIAQHFNIDAKIIGHCEAAPTKALTIKSPYGTLRY